jgi:hypothetical protein
MAKLEDATEYNEQIECVHIEKKEKVCLCLEKVVEIKFYSGIEQRKLISLIN